MNNRPATPEASIGRLPREIKIMKATMLAGALLKTTARSTTTAQTIMLHRAAACALRAFVDGSINTSA
jgi:hypothetical protein